jgi:LEA14-like dessication related protein
MKNIKKYFLLYFIVLGIAFGYGCSAIKQLSETFTNVQRLQFKLESVSNCSIAGIGINGKSKISDFGVSDAFKLTQAFGAKKFPAEFILNVNAKNPNDGTGGTKATSATITRIQWRLLIDDVPTVEGDITSPITVPGKGQAVTIPVSVSLDLYQFFKNKSYDSIMNLAFAIGGVNGSPSRLKLDIKPSVRTEFGEISYPGRITVIDKEYK